jgi:hypothetical protein
VSECVSECVWEEKRKTQEFRKKGVGTDMKSEPAGTMALYVIGVPAAGSSSQA